MSLQTDKSRLAARVARAVADYRTSAGVDPTLFATFARAVLERIRGPFLSLHRPQDALALIEASFRHVARRAPGEIGVSIQEGGPRGLIVLTHLEDQPFIIDTVRLVLRRAEAEFAGGFNVIIPVRRDVDGALVGVGGEGAVAESVALVEIDSSHLNGEAAREELCARLTLHLELARAAVRDFRPMTRAVERFRERCEAMAERGGCPLEVGKETAAFLAWMLRENFVLMGLEADGVSYGIQTIDGPFRGAPGRPWRAPHPPGTVFVRKGDVESPIHRDGRVDEVRVVIGEGGAQEELLLRGMFTYRAVTQPKRNVPILQRVLRNELERQGANPGSFRFKGISNAFDSLPTEFLLTTPQDAIGAMIDLILDSEQQQEAGTTILTYEDGTAFALVSMPKSQYSEELRRDVQQELRRGLGSTYLDHGVFFGRFETVLLHYYLTGVKRRQDAAVQNVSEAVRQLATPWEHRLWQTLSRTRPEEIADALADNYGRAFPDRWTRVTPVERAIRDIDLLEQLDEHGIKADLYEEGDRVRLRIYEAEDATLTALLPMLDHFGLTVIRSEATEVKARHRTFTLDTFDLDATVPGRATLLGARERLVEALPVVFARQVEDDVLGALVVTAGLRWHEVDVLRGYVHYLRQLQFVLPAPRMRSILLAQPEACGALYALFQTKFSPGFEGDRAAALEAADARVVDLIRAVETHDEDVALTAMLGLVRATLRTNAFRDDRVGIYVSFKFDCARVRDMKPEKPLYEIYVHAREVEGVHLRFGKVARGGLRWSDRADYRTEVLGLVTTQQVKNVVIVPEGSKGGFYLHYPEMDAAGRRRQADQLYETFIRGLLDLTDNVVDGEPVGPRQVVCHDAVDPYLVVAADKGTAHLSDTANRLSEAYGFWLGDAFASGGSNGYDHKGVGITARGAWVLVKRHFAEIGINPYKEPITAIGIGDMGGDVFGNGLIETPFIRLRAAFNHAHVFLDPEPDIERSFAERKRLFAAGRLGGWDHYDGSVISAGGGVFSRTSKAIVLSPAAQLMLGLNVPSAPPEDVIRAILRMEVDLLWSGGIGTYVKATRETNEDADDRTNDRARVNASDLRCRVVGEGANLSFTQAARIEAGLRGIRLNTDFVDNSAGVDLSDHEVNLKILLRAPAARGELSFDERNVLLEKLTEEVASLVLVNNDTQGRQLSRDRARTQQDVFPFGRAISFIERHFKRTRESFVLPGSEVLGERAVQGQGLTRPELSTLSAHVKRYVYAELMASGRAKELTGYRDLLVSYFPKEIQARYLDDILNHQLADEIAMTMATTRVVGDAGAAFVPLAVESTGRSVFSVVDAYLRAQHLARAQEVRATLEELRSSVRLEALTRAWVEVDAGCREVTLFWLSSGTRTPTDAELSEMSEAVQEVYALQADDVTRRNSEIVDRMRGDDIPEAVAKLVLQAQYLNIALMVWWHAKKLGVSLREAVVRQLAAGRASRLQEIIDALGRRPTAGQWEPIAMRILVNRFNDRLRQLVVKLGVTAPATSVDELEPLLVAGPLQDVRAQVDGLMPAGAPLDLPAILVLEERLAGAIGRIEA